MKISFLFALMLTSTLLWINDAYAADLQNEIADTQALIKRAKSVDSLWRDTEKLVVKAKELMHAGNHGDAAALLDEAKQQAELGHSQALSQSKNNIIPYYLAQ